ncbi:hypothetical protein N9M16_01885 [Candidatus Dependentiae bacterium]|nr:hypothetical protein [Candidatus Dependentiae bacterium]
MVATRTRENDEPNVEHVRSITKLPDEEMDVVRRIIAKNKDKMKQSTYTLRFRMSMSQVGWLRRSNCPEEVIDAIANRADLDAAIEKYCTCVTIDQREYLQACGLWEPTDKLNKRQASEVIAWHKTQIDASEALMKTIHAIRDSDHIVTALPEPLTAAKANELIYEYNRLRPITESQKRALSRFGVHPSEIPDRFMEATRKLAQYQAEEGGSPMRSPAKSPNRFSPYG